MSQVTYPSCEDIIEGTGIDLNKNLDPRKSDDYLIDRINDAIQSRKDGRELLFLYQASFWCLDNYKHVVFESLWKMICNYDAKNNEDEDEDEEKKEFEITDEMYEDDEITKLWNEKKMDRMEEVIMTERPVNIFMIRSLKRKDPLNIAYCMDKDIYNDRISALYFAQIMGQMLKEE